MTDVNPARPDGCRQYNNVPPQIDLPAMDHEIIDLWALLYHKPRQHLLSEPTTDAWECPHNDSHVEIPTGRGDGPRRTP